MKVFHCDQFTYDLPDGHAFPVEKYRMLRLALLGESIIPPDHFYLAPAATKETICLAHTPTYYESVINGTLSKQHIRQIGLPWSLELVTRAQYSIGCLISAAKCALSDGIAGSLSGGTHHAFPDEGRGFCIFNDVAVATLYLLKEKLAKRVAVIDLDAHQGNGTAAILNATKEVFILDIHGSKNYPVRKVPASLDIALPEYTGDDEYMKHLVDALPKVFEFAPDIIFFIAGVDPIQGDRFGKFALSLQGLQDRDEFVLWQCQSHQVPVALSMGGGYAIPIELTIQAHVNTYRAASKVFSPSLDEE